MKERSMSILGSGHCDPCRWWGAERAHNDDGPYGTCRALAPKRGKSQALTYHDPDRPSVAGPIVRRGEWPWTAFDDWCGAHENKPSQSTGVTDMAISRTP